MKYEAFKTRSKKSEEQSFSWTNWDKTSWKSRNSSSFDMDVFVIRTRGLKQWLRKPEFPFLEAFLAFRRARPEQDLHLVDPRGLWDLWNLIDSHSPLSIPSNPPSSGFIGSYLRNLPLETVPGVCKTGRRGGELVPILGRALKNSLKSRRKRSTLNLATSFQRVLFTGSHLRTSPSNWKTRCVKTIKLNDRFGADFALVPARGFVRVRAVGAHDGPLPLLLDSRGNLASTFPQLSWFI